MDTRAPLRPDLGIGFRPGELPRSECVLLLVDFINPLQFDGSEALAPEALLAARMTASLKRNLASRGVPAIYANDNFGVWRSDFRDVLAHCAGLPGSAGEIARLLEPGPEDLTILKPRHSGFYATPLDLLLTQLHARRLILVGLAADICVQLTAMDAHLRGYAIWVPADCTAAESPDRKRTALEYLERVLKCDVRPVSDGLPEGFGASAPPPGEDHPER